MWVSSIDPENGEENMSIKQYSEYMEIASMIGPIFFVVFAFSSRDAVTH